MAGAAAAKATAAAPPAQSDASALLLLTPRLLLLPLQGHAGSCFQTFHRAWLLEFELALLAVVPELRVLPYWDLTLDSSKGEVYRGVRASQVLGSNFSRMTCNWAFKSLLLP